MSTMCSLPSIPTVLFAAIALTGCYDLSAPTGPRRDDFVHDRSGTGSQEQDQTQRALRADAATESIAVDDASALIDALDRGLEAAALADERASQTPLVTPDTIR